MYISFEKAFGAHLREIKSCLFTFVIKYLRKIKQQKMNYRITEHSLIIAESCYFIFILSVHCVMLPPHKYRYVGYIAAEVILNAKQHASHSIHQNTNHAADLIMQQTPRTLSSRAQFIHGEEIIHMYWN